MAMIKVPAGKCFIKHGTAVNALYMVIHGTVRQVSKLEEVQIGSGNIIGLMDCAEEEYIADYVAADDVTLYPFHYHALVRYLSVSRNMQQHFYLWQFVRQTICLDETRDFKTVQKNIIALHWQCIRNIRSYVENIAFRRKVSGE